jgi:TonB family protein
MLDTLLESQRTHTRQYRYTIASVLAHSALVVGSIAATTSVVTYEGPEPLVATRITLVPVAEPEAPPHSSPRGDVGATGPSDMPPLPMVPDPAPTIGSVVPTSIPPLDSLLGSILRRATEELGTGRGDDRGNTETREGAGSPGGYYTSTQVERTAALRAIVEPPYPALLRSSGVTGRVRVHLVVDTLGRVDINSVRVRESSHELFTEAVLSVLPKLRFRQALIDGRPVPQLVELPFEFSLHRR